MIQGKKLFQTACIAALSCAFTAGVANAGQARTFTANINTTEFLVPSPLCSSQQAGVGAGIGSSNLFAKTADGAAVPIGMTSTDCVQADGGTATQPPATLNFYQGHLIITGPAGDSITATYSGTLNFVSPVTINGQTLLSYQFQQGLNFVITGGTGRFAKASGSGTINGTEAVNFLTGTSQGQLEASGTINY